MAESREVLRRRALRLTQAAGKDVFLFCMSPADLVDIANVSRDESQSLNDLLGGDRASVRQHLGNIQAHVESNAPVMLTPVVLALSPETVFRGSRGPEVTDGLGTSGTLEIPHRTRGGKKPAWVLDGYFRVLAFSQAKSNEFAVPVCALIADNPAEMRELFLRIQSTHPLPADFANVLLPLGNAAISPTIAATELPNAVCDWLASELESPFFKLIGSKDDEGNAKTKSPVSRKALAETISNSLSTPYGALFPYRNVATGETDINGLCDAVKTYWAGVKAVFPDAWGKPAKKTRLTHPAGIGIMGQLLNRVLPAVDLQANDRVKQVARELRKIEPFCRWTAGVWEELDQLPWDQLSNSARHISLVGNFLMRAYVSK